MNYGYIIGQESASLAYFELRLQRASSPDERKDLENVIRSIKRALEVNHPGVRSPAPVPSRFSISFQSGIGR